MRRQEIIMSYISFLDLLGTKDLSMQEETAYSDSIKVFGQCISEGLRNSKCKAYAFSDCAYLQAETLIDMLGVLSDLRDLLLQERRFFSAAVTVGTLNADISSDEENRYVCQSFAGADVSRVYVKQSRLKGIGIWLDESVICNKKVLGKKYRSIPNFCIPNIEEPKRLLHFYDLQIDTKEENLKAYFDFAMKSYRRANIKSKRYGRYYISLLINILSAIDFSENAKQPVLEYEKTQGWYISSQLLKSLFDFCHKDEYFIHNAPGYVYIFLYLLNNLYNENSCGAYTQAFLKKIVELHVIDEYIYDLSNVPEGLLSKQAEINLIEDYCNLPENES